MPFLTRLRSAGLLLIVSYSTLGSQQSDTTRLPRAVVTATRSATAHGAGVATSSVLYADSLRDRGVTDVADALRLVAGLHVVRTGGPGTPVSLFLRGGESDHVRVLVDGVPVNEPGGAVDLSRWTLDGIDRIEVVRGPASVLYGSDAMTGVVQVFTRSNRDLSLRVSRGSFGTVVRDVSVGGRREGLSATLGAARRSSDGLHPFNSGWWNEALRARVSGSLAGVAVQASALQHRDTQHFPTTGSGAVVDRNAVRSGRRSTISLDASRSVGSRVRVVAGLASLEGRGRTLDGPDGPADTVGLFAYRNASSVRRRVADTHAEVLVGSRLLATLGAEWSEEAQRSRDSSNYGGTPAFAARRTTRALYVQTAGGTSRLQTVLGARHDDNSAFGSFSTARGGAAYQLTSSVQLRANVGTAFKAPAMLEQFNTAFTVGNPDLSPERSRVLEVAIAHQRRRSSWSATWFAQRFTNLIQYAYQESGPNYFNVARASSQGLETEGTLAATRGVTLQGGATWLKTRVLDAGVDEGVAGATFVRGQRLLRRPNRTATLGVAINRWQPIDVRTDLMYVGTRDDRDFGSFPAVAVRLDPWVRWDASAQYHLRSGIAVLLRGENLLGERYQEVFGFAAPGRALTVGLTVTSKR